MRSNLTIATRGSQLALWQANHIKSLLETRHLGLSVELLIIKTTGDKILDVPLAKVGGKGLFVKEIEDALLDGRAQIAVHSMKDVPVEQPEGLVVDVVPKREAVADMLLSRDHPSLEALPQGARVGTSSLRRQAQLLTLRPDLRVETLRGNLDTRVRKALNGDYDAIVVAAAGLNRLGLSAPHAEALLPPRFYPAVAQGALGIERAEADAEVAALLDFLNDPVSRATVQAERGFLTGLDGGCQVPIAAHATMPDPATVELTGLVCDVDGTKMVKRVISGPAEHAAKLGLTLAKEVLAAGGKAILDKLYDACAPAPNGH